MGHGKLRKFAENLTFSCLVQPDASEVLAGRGKEFLLKDHPLKGRWNEVMFDAPRPIVLELGCGRGEYTIDLARRNPDCNYIGVDIKGARLWRGAKSATEGRLGNVAFLRTRIEFIEAFFSPGEISEIWLTFSDPQLRHENSRLSCPMFLGRYLKFLAPGGLVHLKTDSTFLYQYTLHLCRENFLPVLAFSEDLYSRDVEAGLRRRAISADESLSDTQVDAVFEVHTYYETMFGRQGYRIKYLCFRLAPGIKSPESFDADYWRSIEGPRHSVALPDI